MSGIGITASGNQDRTDTGSGQSKSYNDIWNLSAASLNAGTYKLVLSGAGTAAGTYSLTSTPVSPVPEPSTYAMMLIGLGAVGFLARRKAKASKEDSTAVPFAAA